MKLSNLIKDLEYLELINFEDVDITGISYNSKTTKAGDIFVCLAGEYTDGHEYFKMAVEAGAKALMVERKLDCHLPQILVYSTRHKIADIADRFYDSPSSSFNFTGVTGTNGKTTVTHLVQKILEGDNKKCALIGTLGYKLTSNSEYKEAKYTTPQAPELQNLLSRIKTETDIENIVMEVSSHALEQNRVGKCKFNGAVLTNLTQDHLDYHITMDKYFEAKSVLFKNIKKGGFAVINMDDEFADRFLSIIPEGVKVFTYGVNKKADITAKNISFSMFGASFICNSAGKEFAVNLEMNGMFSVYNVLAAIATAKAMDINYEVAVKSLEHLKGVAGRFEIVSKRPIVIVDYAHTPDGLYNVLNAAREITPSDGKLICLFGCGGDRDTTKRPKMGAIAEQMSDKIIITSDNPRSEDPQQIITDILSGLKSINTQNILVEPDRGKAIAFLKTISTPNDVIVIAGKGHEDYQILKDRTIHFDDREEAQKVFSGEV